MTPSTWFTVFAFFVFVAPGLLYDLTSAKKRLKRRESAFTEISRITLVSTVCSAASLGVLALISWIVGLWMHRQPLPDLAALIQGGSVYITSHPASVVTACILGLAASLGFSYAAFEIIHRGDDSEIVYTSAWRWVLRTKLPKDSVPYVEVKLKNGVTWAGRVAAYAPDPEIAERDIVLCPPLAVKKKSGDPLKSIGDKWQRVVLVGPEVVSIAVTYGPEPP
ncbi:DUF6338 family protein [Rhodococcus sp. ARC_M8]|uniref:DUF6338 family protein n=1 Tax=Rhodococcus sp. ARC_M8 TaxID=2928853 RepID=UPI001FB23D4A|nr:DUF6338 family protein [Rhodococcus sp. ARC_M8]MCJ0949969.1 DUF6338 family protein [Rhodococcus sp. ARC_M8]